jgi:hypothetical protein
MNTASAGSRSCGWAPVGEPPIALGHHRFEWLYVTAFVEPATGWTVWNIANAVCEELFELILVDFARSVGAGDDKCIVVQRDNAGWHGPENLAVPDGILSYFSPNTVPSSSQPDMKAEPEKVHQVRLAYPAFLLVHLEPHAPLKEMTDRSHDVLSGPRGAHEDVAISLAVSNHSPTAASPPSRASIMRSDDAASLSRTSATPSVTAPSSTGGRASHQKRNQRSRLSRDAF